MSETSNQLIISGNGESKESAVKFVPCHVRIRVAAERRFVCERYGEEWKDWQEGIHYTTLDSLSVWVIELSDGGKASVYSDTSQTIYDEA